MAQENRAEHTFWDRLLAIDRRIIYLVMAIGVTIPYLVPFDLPVRPTAPVKRLFDHIDNLPPGSHVVISADYDPGTKAELDPMVRALINHCFQKNIIPVGMSMGPPGVQMFQRQAEELAKIYGKEEGKDWVNLGFKPGGAFVVILGMGRDIQKVFPTDHRGVDITKLPAMRGVRNFDDIGVVVTISGAAWYATWVQFAQGRFGAHVAAGVTGVMAPDCYPYLQTGQLVGMIGGLKGAAEYEELVDRPWHGKIGMNSQSVAHFTIILFVIVGNIAVLASARARRRRQ